MRICGIRRADKDLIGFGAMPSTSNVDRGIANRLRRWVATSTVQNGTTDTENPAREEIRLMA
jgi:hypothetical protein